MQTSHAFPDENPYQLKQPEWTKDALIYQVNTRQFSEQGTFAEVTKKLAHIASFGTKIIWLMPIHPIGMKNRKGDLGSPYAVQDFMAVNPELGDEQQLKTLVFEAHKLEMKVIIDWVPNHSAWDNPLVESNPDWYARNHDGDFRPSPWWDWSDIIEFDYSQPALREYMINALKYWITEYDLDGFRCDVAGYVPKDFWHQARVALEQIKPVFMLAEWENRDLHETAFNMTYAWSWNETLHSIAMGKGRIDELRKYYSWNERAWPHSALRMTFVSNHDKNAWDGTQHEQFAHILFPSILLSVLGEGMPLIYNSQECGEAKRLAFFKRDPIEWKDHEVGDFYKKLMAIKQQYPALHNGEYGPRMLQVDNDQPSKVLSFVRQNDTHRILVCVNLSNKVQRFTLSDSLVEPEGLKPLVMEGDKHDFDYHLPVGGYTVELQILK